MVKVSMDIPSGSTMRRWDGKSFRWCKAHDDLFPNFPGERWANVGEEKVMWSQRGTMARRPGMQTRSSTRSEAKRRNTVETRTYPLHTVSQYILHDRLDNQLSSKYG